MAEQKAAPAPEPEQESAAESRQLTSADSLAGQLAGQALASAAVTSARVASDLRGWRSPSPPILA